MNPFFICWIILCPISVFCQPSDAFIVKPSKSLADTIYYKRVLLWKYPYCKGIMLSEEEMHTKMKDTPEALTLHKKAVKKYHHSNLLEYAALPIAFGGGALTNSPEVALISFLAAETLSYIWFTKYRNYERKAIVLHNAYLLNIKTNDN
jgi:hypothetical protein